MKIKVITVIVVSLFLASSAWAQMCFDCHKKVTPNIVSDWQLSKHSRNDVDCSVCHGDQHSSAEDVEEVEIPTPQTCALCHQARVQQFSDGKHAKAWAAMKALPTAHWQPMALMEGMKGCGGCHKIGLKSKEDIEDLKGYGPGFGVASCDACHTRHIFSANEARQPQACQTCHMGIDHPQWEMYSSSKHGVRFLLKQNGTLPQEVAAPTCQTCHMGIDHPQWEMYSSSKHGVRFLLKQNGTLPEAVAAPTCQICHMRDGNHAVRTAWGFLAVRLPMPEDEDWAADRTTVLQGLGVLDPDGQPTARLDVVKAADLARLTQEDWQMERNKMLSTCGRCHSTDFANAELEKGDAMIREADELMAEAIRIISQLYQDEIIPKPEYYAYPYPDLLTFHDAPTVIEQKLFLMFLKHRMRTFQGAFHANPDYALWYGWSEMQQDLTEIKSVSEELRRIKQAEEE